MYTMMESKIGHLWRTAQMRTSRTVPFSTQILCHLLVPHRTSYERATESWITIINHISDVWTLINGFILDNRIQCTSTRGTYGCTRSHFLFGDSTMLLHIALQITRTTTLTGKNETQFVVFLSVSLWFVSDHQVAIAATFEEWIVVC